MSTAYHAQTDGQTERANRTIEDILRAYIDHRQNDWDQHLTAVEITYNNSQQSSTGFSPYYLNYGQHPEFPISAVIVYTENSKNAVVAERNMESDQSAQQRQANQHRSDVECEVGQLVWLSTAELRLRMTITPKLSPRWIGPFRIKRKLSLLTYELDLPSSLSIHPVFHISRLRLHRSSEGFDRLRPPAPSRPPPQLIDEQEEYEVEAIRDHRERKWRNKLYKQYLVKWKGYPEWENTWEWEDTLESSSEIVQQYEQLL